MNCMCEIAESLKKKLSERYAQVRITSIQTPEQFMREINNLNSNKLPAAVIVFDSLNHRLPECIAEYKFTIVVIDRFVAGSSERALSILLAGDQLLELFPGDGMTLDSGAFVTPEDILPASPDQGFAALALGIRCQVGI